VAQHSSKRYPAEFKRDAAKLVRSSPDRAVAEIATELGVSDQSLRKWVDQARIDAGRDRGGVGLRASKTCY
jgi:transposase